MALRHLLHEDIDLLADAAVSPVRLVMVEDSLPDVMLVEEALREQSIAYRLIHFKDGVEALRTLSSEAHTDALPDLIILDLNMPRMGGLELLAQLKQHHAFRDVPTAILSSSVQPQERAEADRLGAVRFIHKPVDLYDFLEEVGGALREILHAAGSV